MAFVSFVMFFFFYFLSLIKWTLSGPVSFLTSALPNLFPILLQERVSKRLCGAAAGWSQPTTKRKEWEWGRKGLGNKRRALIVTKF